MRLASSLLLLVFAVPGAVPRPSLLLTEPKRAPGMVLEWTRDFDIAGTFDQYVDGKLEKRINLVGHASSRVRNEILEYDDTHMRSRITFLEARVMMKVNGFSVPTPLAVEGKVYLVERGADGHLLAGDAEGNPLGPGEAATIRETMANYGVRLGSPVPVTIGKPLGTRLRLDREVDELPFAVGTREVNGQQQAIFANVGRARTDAGGMTIDAAVSGHMILSADLSLYEDVDYGVGEINKSERKGGHRLDTTGGFVLVIRSGEHPATP